MMPDVPKVAGVAGAPGDAGGGPDHGTGEGGDVLDGLRHYGEVIVEIGDEMNRQVMFNPMQERLRGRWDPHHLQLGDTSSAGLMQMPPIPGMYVCLSLTERKGVLLDPLSLAANATLLSRVSHTHHGLFKAHCTAVETKVKAELTDDDLATWLYWMYRIVSGGQGRLISGSLPDSPADIKRRVPKGKVRREFYNSNAVQEAKSRGEGG
jgi:hypothetical protein